MGEFIKVSEETKIRRYTTYAKICVYMHLDKSVTDLVSLFHDDFEWAKTMDYEHVPFVCWKFHEHGHLFKDFPLNQPPKSTPSPKAIDLDGFTKSPNHKKHSKKPNVT